MLHPKELRRKIQETRRQLQGWEQELERLERSCPHRWTKAKYDPIRTPGFQTAGDPPGTMGVDRQLPMWIPPTTTDRWTRECLECGKVEETRDTQVIEVLKTPVFHSRR